MSGCWKFIKIYLTMQDIISIFADYGKPTRIKH